MRVPTHFVAAAVLALLALTPCAAQQSAVPAAGAAPPDTQRNWTIYSTEIVGAILAKVPDLKRHPAHFFIGVDNSTSFEGEFKDTLSRFMGNVSTWLVTPDPGAWDRPRTPFFAEGDALTVCVIGDGNKDPGTGEPRRVLDERSAPMPFSPSKPESEAAWRALVDLRPRELGQRTWLTGAQNRMLGLALQAKEKGEFAVVLLFTDYKVDEGAGLAALDKSAEVAEQVRKLTGKTDAFQWQALPSVEAAGKVNLHFCIAASPLPETVAELPEPRFEPAQPLEWATGDRPHSELLEAEKAVALRVSPHAFAGRPTAEYRVRCNGQPVVLGADASIEASEGGATEIRIPLAKLEPFARDDGADAVRRLEFTVAPVLAAAPETDSPDLRTPPAEVTLPRVIEPVPFPWWLVALVAGIVALICLMTLRRRAEYACELSSGMGGRPSTDAVLTPLDLGAWTDRRPRPVGNGGLEARNAFFQVHVGAQQGYTLEARGLMPTESGRVIAPAGPVHELRVRRDPHQYQYRFRAVPVHVTNAGRLLALGAALVLLVVSLLNMGGAQ